MLRTSLVAFSIFLVVQPVWATSWGLNSFSDSVYWSDTIVIAKIKSVKQVEKGGVRQPDKLGGYVDVTVEILESLKGKLTGDMSVTRLALGDATLNASPYPPLPKDLVGQELFLMLRPKGNSYEAFSRGLITDGKVVAMAFHGLREASLKDLRAAVAELLPIQAACPRDGFAVKDEKAALAACRTAILSKYPEVVWYGARRLSDRTVPKDFVDDLAALARKEKQTYPVRYLLVKCLAKTADLRAVQTLIEVLRSDHKDIYAANALKDLTGQNFGGDVVRWQSWWDSQQKPKEP